MGSNNKVPLQKRENDHGKGVGSFGDGDVGVDHLVSDGFALTLIVAHVSSLLPC